MIESSKENMIRLNLTVEQAYYLRLVLMHVSGSPKGPRGQMDEILNALYQYDGDFEELDLPELDIEGDVSLDNFKKKA